MSQLQRGAGLAAAVLGRYPRAGKRFARKDFFKCAVGRAERFLAVRAATSSLAGLAEIFCLTVINGLRPASVVAGTP